MANAGLTDQELLRLQHRLEQVYAGNSTTTIWSPTYWDVLRAGMSAGLVREDTYTTAGLNGVRRRRYVYTPREVENILEGKW